MVPVVSLLDRPALGGLLAGRGMRLAEAGAAVVLRARAPVVIEAMREAYPGAAILALGRGDAQQVALLDAGADDVADEGVSDVLVAARLAALVRRAGARVQVGDLSIDTVERVAARGGRRLTLRAREYALLLHLARRAGTTVPRAVLLADIWGLGFDPGTNVVEVHVSRLRAELDGGGHRPMLQTRKGRGYTLVPAGGSVAKIPREDRA